MTDTQSGSLVLAVPSKGRLMADTLALFAKAGLSIRKVGNERGYRGEVAETPAIEVAFISASEIAHALRDGKVHLGVTGEDLLRETIPDMEERAQILKPLGFGHADVVVAIPNFWVDVVTMADLEEAAVLYRRRHGTRMRVATKYMGLTRRFFAGQRFDTPGRTGAAVTMYRIVESLGATEGAPAAGTAELIVDITSTGSTLKANGLRVLADGIMLKSQANLVMSRSAEWSAAQVALRDDILRVLEP